MRPCGTGLPWEGRHGTCYLVLCTRMFHARRWRILISTRAPAYLASHTRTRSKRQTACADGSHHGLWIRRCTMSYVHAFSTLERCYCCRQTGGTQRARWQRWHSEWARRITLDPRAPGRGFLRTADIFVIDPVQDVITNLLKSNIIIKPEKRLVRRPGLVGSIYPTV